MRLPRRIDIARLAVLLLPSAGALQIQARQDQAPPPPPPAPELIDRYYPYGYNPSNCAPDPSRQVAIGPVEDHYQRVRSLPTEDSSSLVARGAPDPQDYTSCIFLGGSRLNSKTLQANTKSWPVHPYINYELSGTLLPYKPNYIEFWHQKQDSKWESLQKFDQFPSVNFSLPISFRQDMIVHVLFDFPDNRANYPIHGGFTWTDRGQPKT